MSRHDRVLGALLGVAVGDAAGLPFEGLSMRRVARRFERAERYRLAGRTGFVSDDTEQTALLGQALALAGPDDSGICTYCFARFGEEPITAIEAASRAGGDTDTHAAIVGGWTGALHGAGALPPALVGSLQAGPFGASHLRGLVKALATETPPPRSVVRTKKPTRDITTSARSSPSRSLRGIGPEPLSRGAR